MKQLQTYISGIMAGLAIALGGTVYLSVENQIVGALFFTVGLFTVCTMNFQLYTGRVCYLFENDKNYALQLPLIWLGNLTGAVLTASDNLGSSFLLAIFCNLLIFIAVDGFKHHSHEIGKYLGLFFGVVAFILCGFEHCVANMYFFTIGGVWSLRTMLYILVMTLGNSVGGLVLPLLRRLAGDARQA